MSVETATHHRVDTEPMSPQIVELLPMCVEDAGEVLTLQRAAYAAEAQEFHDPFLPALTQTLEELVDEIRSGGGFVLRLNGRLVGAVRTRTVRGEMHIGRLTVAPDMQHRGFGGALLFAAEEEAAATDVPNTRSDEVALRYSGSLSDTDIRMYTRRGYVETHRESLTSGAVLAHMRKAATVPISG